MPKAIAIIQSNYIPWKGYFDLMNSVDEFILYDHCQYTKNDWRNRNLIKTRQGSTWLTIPVKHTSLEQRIDETHCTDSRWRRKHWSSLAQSYSKAPYFDRYRDTLEALYSASDITNLSDINLAFLDAVRRMLGIRTRIRLSNEFDIEGDRTEKLLGICRQCEATTYLSGPAAKSYFDVNKAEDQGISVKWIDYGDYPEYPQLFPPFEHAVSVLDLLFNTGPDAPKFMKSFAA